MILILNLFLIPYYKKNNCIKKIDELFEQCLKEKNSKEKKKEFYSFLKNATELECWDLISWGEKKFKEPNLKIRKELLKLGDDICFRVSFIAAVGAIFGGILGTTQKKFLQNIYSIPFISAFFIKGTRSCYLGKSPAFFFCG